MDFSHRHVRGIPEIRRAIRDGELYAMDLAFHNACGPDKPWFYDIEEAGRGCVMDPGSHPVDPALWITDGRKVAGAFDTAGMPG